VSERAECVRVDVERRASCRCEACAVDWCHVHYLDASVPDASLWRQHYVRPDASTNTQDGGGLVPRTW